MNISNSSPPLTPVSFLSTCKRALYEVSDIFCSFSSSLGEVKGLLLSLAFYSQAKQTNNRYCVQQFVVPEKSQCHLIPQIRTIGLVFQLKNLNSRGVMDPIQIAQLVSG